MSVEYVTESCAACGRRVDPGATESSHYTSEGVVRYRRCACGRCWVDIVPLSSLNLRTELRLGDRN